MTAVCSALLFRTCAGQRSKASAAHATLLHPSHLRSAPHPPPSGGLGGAFGFLWATGVRFPYPEGRPWESSWQQRVRARAAVRTERFAPPATVAL